MARKTQETQIWMKKDDSTLVLLGKVTDAGVVGGARSQIDVTDLDSDEMEFVAGLASPGAVSLGINFDPADTSHEELETMYQAGTVTHFVIGLSDGATAATISTGTITYASTRSWIHFDAYIADFPLAIPKNDVIRGTLTLQRTGARTILYKA